MPYPLYLTNNAGTDEQLTENKPFSDHLPGVPAHGVIFLTLVPQTAAEETPPPPGHTNPRFSLIFLSSQLYRLQRKDFYFSLAIGQGQRKDAHFPGQYHGFLSGFTMFFRKQGAPLPLNGKLPFLTATSLLVFYPYYQIFDQTFPCTDTPLQRKSAPLSGLSHKS